VRICLSRNLFGTPQHLLKDLDQGTFGWVRRIPADTWVLGDPNADLDLGELAHAQGQSLTWEPPEAHVLAFQELRA